MTNERTETHACDSISRQAAIDAFSNNGSFFVYGADVCKAIVSRIKQLPAAEPESGWVSCSERLPEESGLYIVTDTGRWVYPVGTRYYNIRADGGFWSGHPGNKVLAWMPLPAPYKEDTE